MLKTELRSYQIKARDRALPHSGFALFAEQRTGKTLITLSIIDAKKPNRVLIVCPKKALTVWPQQIKQHLKIDWDVTFEFITFSQLLVQKSKLYRRKSKGEWSGNSLIICDESHLIKNRGSKVSKTIRTLARSFKLKLALTGTPISPKKITRGKKSYIIEGLQDIWAQYDFIDPRIFGKWAIYDENRAGRPAVIGGFESRYCIKGGFKKHSIIAYRNRKSFDEKYHKYSFRITFDEASEKKLKRERVKMMFELGDQSRAHYDRIQKYLETVVNGQKVKVPLVLSATMKLQQLTGGFLIDTDTKVVHRVGNEKLNVLKKLLVKRKKPNEPWIIVARFIHELEEIMKLVRKLGLKTIAISGKNEYDPDQCRKSDIIVLQIASGVAIDLAVASTTVYYSWDYSYINSEQSKFRMIEYGKELITYYFLIARDTVDDLMYQATTRKKDLATLVCDHYRRRNR